MSHATPFYRTNPACGTLQCLLQFVGGRHIVVSLVVMVCEGIDINSVTLVYDLYVGSGLLLFRRCRTVVAGLL